MLKSVSAQKSYFAHLRRSSSHVSLHVDLVPPLLSLGARRSYYNMIPEDAVPAGARTSLLHSSSVPSERVKVMKEYAFAPLFGARRAVCLLGSTLPRKRLMEVKASGGFSAVLANLLEVDASDIELGPIEMLQDRILHRAVGDALCPRVSPVNGSRVADSLIPVYLREEAAVEDEDRLALGEVLLAMFELGEARELQALGVSHVELDPEDSSGFTFDSLGGREVTDEEVIAISNRWDEREERLQTTS